MAYVHEPRHGWPSRESGGCRGLQLLELRLIYTLVDEEIRGSRERNAV